MSRVSIEQEKRLKIFMDKEILNGDKQNKISEKNKLEKINQMNEMIAEEKPDIVKNEIMDLVFNAKHIYEKEKEKETETIIKLKCCKLIHEELFYDTEQEFYNKMENTN